MSKRKRTVSTDQDSELIDQLSGILSNISDSQDGDVSSLQGFLDKGYGSQILQTWALQSQTGNHAKLTIFTSKLGWLISECGKHSNLVQYGRSFIREILENQTKVIYRCMFISRASVTNPILRLLSSIINFRNGTFVADLFSTFDFSLKVIPKLLSSNDIRKSFIQFYSAFIRNGSSVIRKDLITQRKVISGWFKSLAQDEADIISETLQVLMDQIILDSSFTKSTKISFFNDWLLGNIVKLLARSDSIAQQTGKLLTVLCTDSVQGVKFQDNGWYPPDSTINKDSNDDFNVYNRLILSVLKLLKPWEDVVQQDIAISILQSSPELVHPYLMSLNASSSFDGKLTSYWISFATFYLRLIKCPIPSSTYIRDNPPSVSVVAENILPTSISKSAIIKALQLADTPLIQYTIAQIVSQSLKKLEIIFALYEKKLWDSEDLAQEVNSRLPDLQVFSSCLNNIPENKQLVKTAIFNVIALYSKTFPQIFFNSNFNLSSQVYEELLGGTTELSQFKLLQTRSSLTIQARLSKVGKWWNRTASASGSNHSIFVTLLRLGVFNDCLTDQIIDLLEGLTKPTPIFQLDTPTSPLHSLIHSLKLIVPTVSDKEQAKIWELIDESVGRCIRSPFKYIDEFAKHRKNSRSVLSPLIVALIEQLRFVDTSTPCQGVEKWLTLLIRDSCILGEDWMAVYGICEGNSQLTSFLSGLKVTDAESFEECQKVCQSMRLIFGDDDVFELIIQSPAKEIIMSQSSLVVTNLFQLYAIRFRILHSANDDNSNELVKCLLNIIPDALFLEILRERYFGGFKQAADPNVIGLYFDRIGERHNHTDTSFDAVKSWVSTITDMRILCKVIWLLDIGTMKRLLPAVDDAKFLEACILDLTERGISIAGIDIDLGRICHQVIASQNEGLLLALEKNLTNLRCGNISNIIASLVDIKSASSTTISKVVSILINASTTVDQSILPIIAQKISEGQYEFVHVVSALCKSCGEIIQPDLVEVAVQFSLEQLSKFKDTSEQLLLNCISLISFVLKRRPAKDDELKILSEFLSNVTGNVSVAGETVELFGALLEQGSETVKMWLRKCILWVTKRFTEDENISSITKTFITAFYGEIVKTRVDIWGVVPSKMINALIEAGLTKWVNADEVLALIAALVFNPSVKNRAGGLEHNKHFQILINHNALTSVKVSAALLIWKLYMMDPASNSNNSTLMRLLSLYNGSNLPEDNILLEVIKQVEAGMGSGWSNQIFSWNIKSINDSTSAQPIDFQGRHPMFNSTRDGFEVTIEVAKIRNSIKTFKPDLCLELLSDQRLQSCLNKINEFVSLYGDLSSLESSYNCEFLLMVLVNCPDFFRGNGTVNVKLLVDTFGLGFVLCCLGSRQLAISRASLDIIATVVHHISLTETENGADQKEESTSTVGLYKERSAIRILLSKILTLISHLEDDAQFLPCNAIILGMLAQVVSNPGHFLYPKAMDFLLSGPTLHSGEIPMYRLFSQPDSSEIAVKELQWGLEALTSGLTTHDEVSLYLRRGVFDWAMTMSMSPWANSIKPHIRALLLKAQEVQGGSIGLVTRNAGLAWAENELFSEKISNKKDQKHFAGKLGLRFMAASDKNKLCQWTGNDRLGIANRFSL